MGIYRCSYCKHIDESSQENVILDCEKCGEAVKVYNSVLFVKNILTRWAKTIRELNSLKSQEVEGIFSQEMMSERDGNLLSDVKISETDILATKEQHAPLEKWFNSAKIRPVFDYSTVDMSGYYDEAAQAIATQYEIFSRIMGRITWSYRKEHSGLSIDLRKYSQKDAQKINNICRELYAQTLFSRYNYNKKNKTVHLKLQKAQPIQQFFNGLWLEWFALDSILTVAKKQGRKYIFSCARSVRIYFPNEDLHELDVVFLPNGRQPLIIECKTGEFRQDLDKYLALRKRLKLSAENFIILATDLEKSQVKSLSTMYNLTFSTLENFKEILEQRL